MFGPSDDATAPAAWRGKSNLHSNDELRQRFVDNTVPQVDILGMRCRTLTCSWI
ncbi:hypothetical protein ACLK1Y_07750 [Escherichia coli]